MAHAGEEIRLHPVGFFCTGYSQHQVAVLAPQFPGQKFFLYLLLPALGDVGEENRHFAAVWPADLERVKVKCAAA